MKEALLFDSRFHIFTITLLFLTTRILFLFTPAGRLGDADQAVFGMMAQRIASLDEFPLFCWEAHYAGAFVSYIAAVIFYFFGSGFVQLRIAMLLIVFPSFFLFYFIYRRIFDGQRAFIGVIYLIFCPYLVLNCTTAAYGGYGESFVGASLIILLSWKIRDQSMNIPIGTSCFLLGLTCGFFTYIQFIVVPVALAFAIPALWTLGENRIKSFWQFSLGGLIGISPLIIYNLMTSGGTLTRGAARVFLIGRDGISEGFLKIVENIFLQKGAYLTGWLSNAPLMFGQYVIPAVLGQALQITAGLMLIGILFIYIVCSLTKRKKKEAVAFYHRQFAFYLLIFILFQWVASLKSDRHFMPLFFVIPVALFGLTEGYDKLKRASIVIIIILSIFQIFGWNQEFRAPRFNPHPIAKIMESQGIREFYSSYWTGYPIMFVGEGHLIGSPMLLPYNEPFSDRRPQYTEQVLRAQDTAFVFAADEESLKSQFLSFLKDHHISFQTTQADRIHILYQFSKPVGVHFIKRNWNNYFFLK